MKLTYGTSHDARIRCSFQRACRGFRRRTFAKKEVKPKMKAYGLRLQGIALTGYCLLKCLT